jgi:pyridoxal phosphate enzyme (YggS family)
MVGAKIRGKHMGIKENIGELERRIAAACERSGRSRAAVTLVAVTKTVPPALVRQAFDAGIRHFGENKVQEAQAKIAEVSLALQPRPMWHMIGHLQTNKVKTAVEIFDIIQSIDSVKLAERVNERAGRKGFPVLLEVNVGGEASKGGFSVAEVRTAVEQVSRLSNLEVMGLMTVAPLAEDQQEVRPIFRQLRQLGEALGLQHLSMGMTDDFEVAIEEGATMVRIGRAIFGERRY